MTTTDRACVFNGGDMITNTGARYKNSGRFMHKIVVTTMQQYNIDGAVDMNSVNAAGVEPMMLQDQARANYCNIIAIVKPVFWQDSQISPGNVGVNVDMYDTSSLELMNSVTLNARSKYIRDMFVEEYTLVAVADYVLQHTPGNTVSNLSSSRALRDVTRKYNCQYNAAAVGEVNVVEKMKETVAVIGGEGNGGVIYPAIHYGRDALVGIALFLSLMAHTKKSVSALKATYPAYSIIKQRIDLTPQIDVDALLVAVKKEYENEEITDIDGVKIDFPDGWVHLRKSNTEPIIRVYAEAHTEAEAEKLAAGVMEIVKKLTL